MSQLLVGPDNVSSCSACGKSVAADPLGDHQVGCRGNGDRIHRHDAIRDALFSAAQSAALAPRKEVPTLIPGTRSSPADIFLPNWCRGRPAALDVTVISTMQPLTQSGAASQLTMPNAEAQVCRLSPLLLSRWEVGAMKQPYRSPESADLWSEAWNHPRFQDCACADD